jgi:hypothetical protein
MGDEKEHVATFIPSLYNGLLKKTTASSYDTPIHLRPSVNDAGGSEESKQQNTAMLYVQDMQTQMKNFVKKTGDAISGQLQILKPPEEAVDAANKEYVDQLFSSILRAVEESKSDINDTAIKNYVDQKFNFLFNHILFSKGTIVHSVKKTFFFNPGFICPQRVHIVSVGFSTSPYKYKIGEKIKLGESNPTKLYFMVNNEIKSEYPIEKDLQLGYILKEFSEPIIVEKGDNLMMLIESIIEDTSVSVSFY